MGHLTRLWKRYVSHSPDCYRLYVNFPLRPSADRAIVAAVRSYIDDLEVICEGRVDVYPRLGGLVVRSDPVPSGQFERASFERVLDRLEEFYRDTHVVASHATWRWCENGLEKSYVVVPVKPLFSESTRATDEDRLVAGG